MLKTGCRNAARRLLPAALAAVVALSVPASGANAVDDRIALKGQYYGDNNDVTVYTSVISAVKRVGEMFGIGVDYLVDGITGASRKDIRGWTHRTDSVTMASPVSVDGVSSASETAEKRREIAGTLSFSHDFVKHFREDKNNDDPTALSLTGKYSREHDYVSRTVAATISQDLFQRNTTFSVSYDHSFDQFLPASRFVPQSANEGWDYYGDGRRQTDHVGVNVTQGITTTTLASIGWSYGRDQGYLAKPYYVYEIDNVFYHENLPPERHSMTLSGRLNQYVPAGKGMSARVDYRFYRDSWAITSHTAELELYFRVAERLAVRPSYRFYHQLPAFFYEDGYTSVPAFLSTDLKYGEFTTNAVGAKFVYEVRDFVKPEDGGFGLYPVTIDLGATMLLRTGPSSAETLRDHYAYWDPAVGYRMWWIQGGMSFAF